MRWAGILIILSAITMMACEKSVLADHEGPFRVVDDRYTVALSITPTDENALSLRFLTNDAKTGKTVSPAFALVSIYDENGRQTIDKKQLPQKDGASELIYTFPESGFYKVAFEFKLSDRSEKLYQPEQWSVWVPGEDQRPAYPLGVSEISGFALVVVALGLLAWNIFVYNKNRKKLKQKNNK